MTNKLNSDENIPRDEQTLGLVQLNWIKAAKNQGLTVRQWAIETLDNAADTEPLNYHLLDDLSYKDHMSNKSPFYFQTVAIRHWVGLTQSDAAKVIELALSAYRNCESEEDMVLMKIDTWNEYVRCIINLIRQQEYDTLPNSFCCGIKGLTGVSYRELNNMSSLSQSYWTTRLRFKQPSTPIELSSVKEILKILIKKIDARFKKGNIPEGRAMLQTILFLAYQTQLIRIEKNHELKSVLHVVRCSKYDASTAAQPKNDNNTTVQALQKASPVNRANLFAITIESLEKRGYHFSEGHPDIQFIYES